MALTGMRRRSAHRAGLGVPVAAAGRQVRRIGRVVPAIGCKMPAPLEHALARPDVRDALAALRAWAGGGASLAAACVGTFVLAEAGLLDGEEATTTWWLAPMFRQRYPEVKLDESRMVVRSGTTVTAGAALSHIDLALALIRQASPELASLVAKYLVSMRGLRRSAYAISDHLIHADPLVERFERWARGRLDHGFSLDEAADALATSKRTLARRIQDTLGKTPALLLPGPARRARRASAPDHRPQHRAHRRDGRLRRRRHAAHAAAATARTRRARTALGTGANGCTFRRTWRYPLDWRRVPRDGAARAVVLPDRACARHRGRAHAGRPTT